VYERLKRGNPAISYKPAYRINKKTGRVSTVPDLKCWHCSFAHGDYSVYRRHSRLHNPREQRTCANPSLEATRPTTVGPELSGLQGVSKEEYERMKNGNPAIKYRKIIRWKRGRRVPETGLKCRYCPYVNTSYKGYLLHSRYHGSKERYTCDVTGCDYSANRDATVTKHQNWHHAAIGKSKSQKRRRCPRTTTQAFLHSESEPSQPGPVVPSPSTSASREGMES
jgi:hypothetical protein